MPAFAKHSGPCPTYGPIRLLLHQINRENDLMNDTTHDAPDEGVETLPPPVRLAAATMTGTLLHALIERMRSVPKVWQQMTEQQQQDTIDAFHRAVGPAIVECAKIIAADGHATVMALIESATVKDGIKAVLTMPRTDPSRHELLDSVNKPVLISILDVAPYGGGERPKPDAMAETQGALELPEPGTEAGGEGEPTTEEQTAAMAALDAGLAAADAGDTETDADGAEDASAELEDAPEPAPAPVWTRDNDRLYDAILTVPVAYTGIDGENAEADFARIDNWTDEEAEAVERFCLAADKLEQGEIGPGQLPPRPACIGGPLPDTDAEAIADATAEQHPDANGEGVDADDDQPLDEPPL